MGQKGFQDVPYESGPVDRPDLAGEVGRQLVLFCCQQLSASRGVHVGRPFGIMVYPAYMIDDAGKHAHISVYVMLIES